MLVALICPPELPIPGQPSQNVKVRRAGKEIRPSTLANPNSNVLGALSVMDREVNVDALVASEIT